MFLVEWWNSLDLALQIFYCIAIPATLVLLVQTILMFIGIGDGDADFDAPDVDFDGDGLADDFDMDIDDRIENIKIFYGFFTS